MKRPVAMIVMLIFVSIGLAQPLWGKEHGKSIQIEKPWARASIIKSRPAAAFMTIVNLGDRADRLVSVSSPMAKEISVHLSEMTNGIMKMSPVHDIPLDSGASVTLKPGGLHLMLMGLRAPLKKGDKLPLIFNFEFAGKIDVQVPILGLGAKGPN